MGMVLNIPEGAMDYAIYGDKTPVISNYIYSQLQQLPKQFNAFSEKLYTTMSDTYNYLTNKALQYNLKNILASNNLTVNGETIFTLEEFVQMQQANLTMQRWVMANPNIRRLWLQNNIDGYSDTYVNIHGKDLGEQHYDYRRVMDGAVQETVDGFKYQTFNDDLLPGDKELDHREKVMIRDTWEAANWLIDNCKFDFTSTAEDFKKINK